MSNYYTMQIHLTSLSCESSYYFHVIRRYKNMNSDSVVVTFKVIISQKEVKCEITKEKKYSNFIMELLNKNANDSSCVEEGKDKRNKENGEVQLGE